VFSSFWSAPFLVPSVGAYRVRFRPH